MKHFVLRNIGLSEEQVLNNYICNIKDFPEVKFYSLHIQINIDG
jgi:hypothetical protein